MAFDTQWGFKKSSSKSKSEDEKKESDSPFASSPPEEKKEKNSEDSPDAAPFGEKGGKSSASSAGLTPVDATCADCLHLSEDETACAKVDLPSDFSAYSWRCHKFFTPKDSSSATPEPSAAPAAEADSSANSFVSPQGVAA